VTDPDTGLTFGDLRSTEVPSNRIFSPAAGNGSGAFRSGRGGAAEMWKRLSAKKSEG